MYLNIITSNVTMYDRANAESIVSKLNTNAVFGEGLFEIVEVPENKNGLVKIAFVEDSEIVGFWGS